MGVGDQGRFGTLLHDLRLAVGWTQADLAERARLSVRGIQHLESGRTQPYRQTVQQLAEALELSPDERQRFEMAARAVPRRRQSGAANSEPAGRWLEQLPTGTVTLMFVEMSFRSLDDRQAALVRTAVERCLGSIDPRPTAVTISCSGVRQDQWAG